MAEATYPTAQETIELLKKDIDDKNLDRFRLNYTSYLKQYPEFKDRQPKDGEASIASYNYIIGDPNLPKNEHAENFRLKSTTPKEVEEIQVKSKAAQEVFAKLSLEDRLDFIEILRKKIDKYKNDIVLTIAADTSKPIDLAEMEVAKANQWFDYAKKAKEQLKTPEGEKERDLSPHGMAEVVAAGNYPLALAIGPAVGALATGNSVVFAIPDKALNTAGPMMKAFREAVQDFAADKKYGIEPEDQKKLVDGLVQSTMGRNDLYLHADILSFVGSDEVGEKMKKARGDKPTILELGGNNVVVVMNSAITKDGPDKIHENAKKIAQQIYDGFSQISGQRCTSPRDIILQKGPAELAGQYLVELVDKGPKVGPGGIGNPMEKGTVIGTLIDDHAYVRIKVGEALMADIGGKLVGDFDTNKEEAKNLPKGSPHFVSPVIFDLRNVDIDFTKPIVKASHSYIMDKNSKILNYMAGNETFGPAANIIKPVNSEGTPEENLNKIIKIANVIDPKHKLIAAVYSADAKDAEIFKKGTGVNTVTLNGAPKDPSPAGMHGKAGEPGVGGENHFLNFTKHFEVLHKHKPDGLGEGAYVRTQNEAVHAR